VEQVERAPDVGAAARQERAAPQVELIRLDVGRPPLHEARETLQRAVGERHLQPLGNRPGDLVLDVEDVDDFTVVALRPELKARLDLAQLHRDADPAARPPDAAAEYSRHVQLLADGLQVVTVSPQ
jgi:hypothetical protein